MTRDNAISIRLSDEERDDLNKAAQKEGIPASIIIRGAIRNEINRLQEARDARERMSNQGFYTTVDGRRFHWDFTGRDNTVYIAGPWPKSPLRGPGVLPLKTYRASSKEEARLLIVQDLGDGDFH